MVRAFVVILLLITSIKATYLDDYSNSLVASNFGSQKWSFNSNQILTYVEYSKYYGMNYLDVNSLGFGLQKEISNIGFSFKLYGVTSNQDGMELRSADTPEPISTFIAENSLFGFGVKSDFKSFYIMLDAIRSNYTVIDYSSHENFINFTVGKSGAVNKFDYNIFTGVYQFWRYRYSYVGDVYLKYRFDKIELFLDNQLFYRDAIKFNSSLGVDCFNVLRLYSTKVVDNSSDENLELGAMLEYWKFKLGYEMKLFKNLSPVHNIKFLFRVI